MATILINSVSLTSNSFAKQPRKIHVTRVNSVPPSTKFPNISESGLVSIDQNDRIFKLPKWNGSSRLEEVVNCFEDMVGRGFKPDSTYRANQLLFDLCRWKKSQKAMKVIELMMSSGCYLDPRPCNTLISYLCKYKQVGSAASLVEKMVDNGYSTNISMHNNIIKGFISMEDFKKAWLYVDKLFQRGLVPTSHTYSILLEGVCMESGVDEAMRLFDYLKLNFQDLNLYSYNTLLTGFCRENRLEEAVEFFKTWPSMGLEPDCVSYDILVKPFCVQGRWKEAKDLLVEMKETGILPTGRTYNMLVGVLAHHGRTDNALGLIEEMIKKGFEPGVVAYNPVIKHLCKQKKVDDVFKCLNQMKARHCQPDTETYNSIVVLCEVGMVKEALTFIEGFYNGQKANLRNNFYSHVLRVLCKPRNPYAAFQLLLEMIERGFAPDSHVYPFLLSGLCSEKTINAWLKIAGIMEEEGGYKVTADNYNQLLHVLCTSGKTDMLFEVFYVMIEKGCMPDEMTYTTIVNSIVCEKELELAALVLIELYSRQLISKKGVEKLVRQHQLEDFVQINSQIGM